MIRLDTTTRTLEIILGGAVTTNELPVVVSYSDKTASTYNGNTQASETTGGTAATIAAAPAASTVRDIDYIGVWNRDTVSAVVRIQYNDNGTIYTLVRASLSPNDQLVYTHGEGWRSVDGSGSTKMTTVNTISNATLDDLDDVTITTPLTGQVLRYTGALWENGALDLDNTDAITGTLAFTFLDPLTADRAVITDNSGVITISATTSAEIGHLSGVTSPIQGQIDGKQPLDSDLTALAAIATTGLYTITGAGASTTRSLVQPAAGVTITNADGVAGNPTFALANDLAALEGLASTGIAVRTAADTWATRTLLGTTNQITLTNGTGVAGDPTVSITTNPLIPGYIRLAEVTAPGVAPTGEVRIYAHDISGTTGLSASFDTDADNHFRFFRDSWYVARNNTGSTITKGQLVYITGSAGQAPVIALAQATGTMTSAVGFAQEDISNNGFGRVQALGFLRGLDTSLIAEGSTIYLSADTPGAYTTTAPTHPNIWQVVGTVISQHASQGIIDVQISTPINIASGTNVGSFAIGTSLTDRAVLDVDGSSLTASRTFLFPDAAGTFALTSDLTAYQPLDADLTAIAAFGSTGFAVRTAADTWAQRTITGTANQITLTNGNGVAGNPIISLPTTLVAPGSVQATSNFIAGTTTDSYTGITGINLTVIPGAAATAVSNGNTLVLRAGAGGGTSGAGGAVTLAGGIPTSGAGGAVNITANAGVGTNQNGGNVVITAGDRTGTGTAGLINLVIPATGSLQINGVSGTSGQVLTSNGATAAPTWQTPAGGGGGAPASAQYVVLALDGTLSAERVLTGTANQITITDGGANGNVTLTIANNPIIPGTASLTLPIGTTAQRPGTPVAGMTRYNSSLTKPEDFFRANWVRRTGVIDKTTVNDVITAAGPTNTYSFIVPANTLGTDSILRLNMQGTWVASGGGNRTVTITVTFGGATMYSDTSATVGTGNTIGWAINLMLAANNATNSQSLNGIVHLGGTGGVTTGVTGDLASDEIVAASIITGSNTSADSTANQTLAISVTFSGGTNTWTKYYHVLELL